MPSALSAIARVSDLGQLVLDKGKAARFDGTALCEHADPRKGGHHDWGTPIFNYGRNEVRRLLIFNAILWLREHHIDGLRVDALSSMIYFDYSRKAVS